MSTPALSPDPKRTLWQRRVLDPIVAQLTQGITPEKIALTVAVGSALALFPILGTTTILCLLAGIALRLNQPMIQMVNFLCISIHLPLIAAAFRGGQWLFNDPPETVIRWRHLPAMIKDNPIQFFHRFGTSAFHAIIVWAIVAPFWIAFFYYALLPALREITRIRAENAAKTVEETPPDHPVP